MADSREACGDSKCVLLGAIHDVANHFPAITVEELQAHIHKLLANVQIHALIVGNMDKDEAIQLIETAEHSLKSSAVTSPIDERGLVPPNGKCYRLSLHPNAS